MLKMSTIHASNRLAKTLFFFFFANDLMSYCTLAIEFLALKYQNNYLFYQLFLSSGFFLLLSFSPLLLLFFFSSHSLILSVAVVSFFFFFYHKTNEIRKKKRKKKRKKRKERDLFMRKRINPNTKQNPILKIKLNQNKQI